MRGIASMLRDRYEPLETVGRGGQGEVVRARDRLHGREVALKIRRVVGSPDDLLREARVLLGMRPHPGVSLVRDDFFTPDGRYVIVMDWVDGENLQSRLQRDGRPGLPFDEVCRWLDDVGAALDHLHAHDPPIVHGDVKPANVVRARDGRAVLVDFGVSSLGTTYAAGTPLYLAPELASGGPATPSVDVFGLAATALVLLTGAGPEPGGEPDWSGIPGSHGAAVAAAIERGLSIDPARRPPSAGAFAAAVRPAVTPHNLPAPISSFVGRDREMRRLGELLASTRLLALTGPGGVGKTRLALELARERLWAYPDGVSLVELAGVTDPDLVPARLASALGLRERPGSSPRDLVVEHLRTGRRLLVLDNCEHLIEACAFLVEDLLRSCAELTILATSRERLRIGGESEFALPPLDLPPPGAPGSLDYPAPRLFVDRARAADPDFDDEGGGPVAAICRDLDGLPLAIELAAANVRSRRLDEIAAGMSRSLELLTGGTRTTPRHETLRAALDWSHDLLDARERTVFRALSVFRGGFTGASAATVCGDGAALDRLVDRSLVAVAGDRCAMLEVVRAYAAERLSEAGEASRMLERHLSWIVGLAEQAEPELRGPRNRHWVEVFDREHDNVVAALRWAMDEGRIHDALRAAAVAWRLWSVHGRLAEGRVRLDAVIAAAGDSPSIDLAKTINGAGALAHLQGDFDAARDRFAESLRVYRELGDELGVATELDNLGIIANRTGDYDRACELHEQSLEMRRRLGDDWGVAASSGNLANALMNRGAEDGASRAFEETLTIMRRLGDEWGIAATLSNLALLADRRGELDEARALETESLGLRRGLGDRPGVATSLSNLANVAVRFGDLDEARALHAEALATRRELGDEYGIGISLHSLGQIENQAGDHELAAALHRESLAVREASGDRLGIALSLEGLAESAAGRDPARAASLLAAAQHLRDTIGAALPRPARDHLEGVLARVRDSLDLETFDAAWTDGATRPLEDVLRVARER